MPRKLDVYRELPDRLEALARGLRDAIRAMDEREAGTDEQMRVDMETGEVEE